MKTKFFRKKSGFTLIELMVVIFLLSMLTLLISSYYSPNKLRAQRGQNYSQSLIDLLRTARSDAVSGRTVGEPPVTPEGGYGFYFSADEKRAFVYSNNDQDSGADPNGDQYDDITDEEIESGEILPNILQMKVERINVNDEGEVSRTTIYDTAGGAPLTKDFWIVFAPNSADVTFGSECCSLPTGPVTEDTKEFVITVILADVRSYTISINKVSRFFEISLDDL